MKEDVLEAIHYTCTEAIEKMNKDITFEQMTGIASHALAAIIGMCVGAKRMAKTTEDQNG